MADATGWVFFVAAAGPNPDANGSIFMEQYAARYLLTRKKCLPHNPAGIMGLSRRQAMTSKIHMEASRNLS